jgi:hypothetical protein
MALEQSQNGIVDVTVKPRCCNMSYIAGGVVLGVALTLLLGLAFYAGRQSTNLDSEKLNHSAWNALPSNRVHPDFLSATATHGGSNMAVCTAQVDENAEGFFALDFVTGDLKGWVYYPRMQKFGGLFMTNVQGLLGASKNPEYLLVSGGATTVASGGNTRPAASLIYVVDMRSGLFAAYAIPWNKTQESSGMSQMNQFIPVDGGQIREPSMGVKKPVAPLGNPAAGGPAGAAPKKPGVDPKAVDPKAADPKAADPKADANNPNPNNRKK